MPSVKTILLTGATSFLGKGIAGKLLSEGFCVIAMIRPASAGEDLFLKTLSRKGLFDCKDENRLHILSLDMAAAGKIENAVTNRGLILRKGMIDACIHLAWSGVGAAGRMDESVQQKNIRETVALMEALSALSCRLFVFAGSQAEYGIQKGPITEEAPCRPLSFYGKAKGRILQEAMKMKGEMEYRHLRIFSVYGYGDHPTSLVSTCVENLLERTEKKPKVLLGPCLQKWNYLYVDDCVGIISSLLQLDREQFRKAGEIPVINVAGEDTRILREFALEIEKILGEPGDIVFGEQAAGAEGVPNLDPSVAKLQRLGICPGSTGFEEGIREIERMYRLQKSVGSGVFS